MAERAGSGGDAVPLNLYDVTAPGVARVLSNDRLTPEGAADVRHVVLDLAGLDFRFREGQSLGVLTPGVPDRGHANRLRMYSIGSGRAGEDGRGQSLALCVKRAPDPGPGPEAGRGASASNYLCDVRPGDPVALAGPFGTSFLLPDDPESNLILAATGTGIAPFRGFLRRAFRELPRWGGEVMLFAGAKTAAESLYRDEFEAYRDRPNFQSFYALSREHALIDGRRPYVHDRMAGQVDALWSLLDKSNTYLYVCGIRGMEALIEGELEARAAADGISWRDFRRVLLDEGRLRVETY